MRAGLSLGAGLLLVSIAFGVGAAAASDAFAVAGVTEVQARLAFTVLQNAVHDNDASAVADMVALPLKVNLPDGKHRVIDGRKQFLVEYPLLFDAKLRDLVLEQKFEGLFVNGAGIMFGRGQLWMAGIWRRV
ncbi:MAG: hypothetical protein ABI629_19140 [bacterium]